MSTLREKHTGENLTRTENLADIDHGYKYPGGLNFRPGTKWHDLLVEEILLRAREASAVLSQRHDAWEKMDNTMTAYITLDSKEKALVKKDERKPVSIVIPTTYAIYEALASQAFATYASQEEMHFYRGRGPEDTLGAILMEKYVLAQSQYFKEQMAIHTAVRDELLYGFSVVSPIWKREMAMRTVSEPYTFVDSNTGDTVVDNSVPPTKVPRESLLFEGNRVFNIDPWKLLPDPNVPIHEIQDGEYIGWVERENYVNLLEREYVQPDEWFNVKYLNDLGTCLSAIYKDVRTRRATGSVGTESGLKPIDAIYMYVNLIPWEWELSPNKRPEKWFLALAADKVIIAARPVALNHNRFPVATGAPDTDGYAATPLSRLEVTYPVQRSLDFMWNSKMAFFKKCLLGEFLVDQSRVNLRDAMNPAPGRIIRVSRLAIGMRIADVMQQLQVNDTTGNVIRDIMALHDWMQRASGATDTLMGIMRTSGERRSATESRGARLSSLSRADHFTRLRSIQSMYDLGYLMASQSSQLMTQPFYARIMGRWEEELRAEFGPNAMYATINPSDLDVVCDVIPGDSYTGGEDFFDSWIQMYQIIVGNPALMQQFDILRLFKHIARMGGAKNVSDFINRTPMQAQVLPPDQVAQQAQAGNIVPITAPQGGAPSASPFAPV